MSLVELTEMIVKSLVKDADSVSVKEFETDFMAKLSNGIRMNIVKRDKIDNPNLSADEICTKFLLDEVFSMYM